MHQKGLNSNSLSHCSANQFFSWFLNQNKYKKALSMYASGCARLSCPINLEQLIVFEAIKMGLYANFTLQSIDQGEPSPHIVRRNKMLQQQKWTQLPILNHDRFRSKISAQARIIVKQLCFPNGNVLSLSWFSLSKNWMHNVVWSCAEILPISP